MIANFKMVNHIDYFELIRSSRPHWSEIASPNGVISAPSPAHRLTQSLDLVGCDKLSAQIGSPSSAYLVRSG